MTNITHPTTCSCCGDMLRGMYDRRRFLQAAAVGVAATALSPYYAFAAEGKYEAMVLGCIDPRLQEPVRKYTVRKNLTGKFSQFVIAGAAIGVVAPAFKDWHKAYWDNLGTSIQLHSIKKVIAINHRDCGAAKIAYGADKVANPKIETETHREAMMDFRKQVKDRFPQLGVDTGLMAINGKIEMFT